MLIEVDAIEVECNRIPLLFWRFWISQFFKKCSHLSPSGKSYWFPAKAKKVAEILKTSDEIPQWNSVKIEKEKWWHEGRWWTTKKRRKFLDKKYGKQTQN